MGTVIQITGKEVKYSLNNYVLSEFEDQQLYEVPPHAARGMVERGWAKLASPDSPPRTTATQPRQPEEAKEEAIDKPKRGGKS